MHVLLWSVAALTLASAAACGGSSAAPPMASSASPAAAPADPAPASAAVVPGGRPRIVFLGDSLTAGLGLPPGETYPSLIQARLDREGQAFEVVNAGVSGDTSAGGLRRLEWSLDGDVAVLVVALGGNDALRGLPPAELRKNLTAIVERAKPRVQAIVLAGMEAPPNNGPEYTAAFRQVYQDVAREHDLRLIPFLLDKVGGVAALNQADGIHPNARGAQIVADTVWSALAPVLPPVAPAK
jgi:acyl-CoA thioesterase-1